MIRPLPGMLFLEIDYRLLFLLCRNRCWATNFLFSFSFLEVQVGCRIEKMVSNLVNFSLVLFNPTKL